MINRKLIYFLFLLIVLSYHNVVAQQIDLSKKITIVVKDEPLKSVLEQISQKGDILFSYSNELIDDKQIVSLIARNQSIQSIFSQLFNELNIDYLFVEKQIILKPAIHDIKKDKQVTVQKFTISGYLKDSETNEVLIGATVRVDGQMLGTVSNAYGFYSLSLPQGNYIIKYSYIGYKSKMLNIKLNKNLNISNSLQLDETDLGMVLITDKESVDILDMSPLKKISLSRSTVRKMPNVGGEPSVVKTLNSIPGISPYGDGSVLFYVRGGNKDQNLIVVDEAPIYNPSHMLGFFSSIAPDAINSISVSKGNFPVQYGGSLSSFIDVRTKDGNMKHFSFQGNISPFTASLSFEGPFAKEKSSYIVTYRTSTLNWLFKQDPADLKMNFYDLHAKFNFKLNRKNRIFFSFYSGADFIKSIKTGYNTFAMSWQNNAGTIRWNHLYSDRFFSNITLYTSKYDYFLYSSVEDDQYWNSMIGNLSLKNDFTFYINPENTMRFGMEINTHYFNPGNQNDEYFEQIVSASGALQTVVYIGNETKLFDKLFFNYSIRGLNWNNTGPAIIYYFNNKYIVQDSTHFPEGIFNTYFNAEPQVEILYALNKTTSFKLSYNHHIQYLNLLSNSVSPFTTLDVWMPAGPNIKPQKSDQYILGFHKKTTEFDFTAEAYYKKMHNQIYYANHANMFLNPLIESELRFGTGTSYGIELFLRKQKGKFTGWLGYSYIRTFRKIKDVNRNQSFPLTYDKPHYITVNLSYTPVNRLLLSLNWVYSSGTRFSSPTGFYYYRGMNVPIYSKKNNSKLPEYHRMDFSADFRLNKRTDSKFKHHILFSIYNLYGRENPVAVNFSKIESDAGAYVIPSDIIAEKSVIPTAIYLFNTVPSLTYRFKFR